jgi:hypothetical protein
MLGAVSFKQRGAMSVINFGPLAQVAPGLQETTRGFSADELPARFVYEAREYLKTKRRGAHMFDKREFMRWINLPGHSVRFTAKSHAESLYERLVKDIKRDEATDRGQYPFRNAAIYECLLSIIYDINKQYAISPQGVIDALRAEVALHGNRAHLGPYEPTFEELEFAIWSWNVNIWNDHVPVGVKDMLVDAYDKIGDLHDDLVYPFETYEDALSAIEEVEEHYDVHFDVDIDHLAKFFVRLHPPRQAEGEFFDTPYDVVMHRHALSLPVSAEPEPVKFKAPPPPPAHVAPPVILSEEVLSSPPVKKRKGRSDWQWDVITRQRALDWVKEELGENAKSLPAHLTQKFHDACIEANPPWVTETVEVKSACQQLLTHVRLKMSNDVQAKKRKIAAEAAAAAVAAAVTGMHVDV